MREQKVKDHIRKVARSLGGESILVQCRGRRGFPDLIVWLPGRPAFFIEAKRPKGGILGPHQIFWRMLAKKCGQTIHVIRTKEQADQLLYDHAQEPSS